MIETSLLHSVPRERGTELAPVCDSILRAIGDDGDELEAPLCQLGVMRKLLVLGDVMGLTAVAISGMIVSKCLYNS